MCVFAEERHEMRNKNSSSTYKQCGVVGHHEVLEEKSRRGDELARGRR